MDALLSSSFISAFSPKTFRPKTTVPNKIIITNVKTDDKPPPPPSPPASHKTFRPKTTVPNKIIITNVKTDDKPPPPPSPPTLPGAIFNALDGIINNFIDPPRRPSVDPRRVLSDNFAPVSGELPPTECVVEWGPVPECLAGAYVRNGPNPQFLPRGPYHLFDGDGMLHALRLSPASDRPPTLCSRYVRTYKYSVERAAGGPLIPNVFSGFSGLVPSAARGALTAARMAAGQFNPANGIGLANTSLALFPGDRLLALGESDLPYRVSLTLSGDVLTLGRYDFSGKLSGSMTAHPKLDPDTGEAFAFRYGPVPPFLTFFRFDSAGEKHPPDVPIFSLRTPSFIHDFAVTKRHAVFSDIQIGMNPAEMLAGGGSPVGAVPGKVPRLGVIPRYAKDESEMRWFDVLGFNIIHAINAWDEDGGDTVVMVAPNIISVEHSLERMELIHAVVERVRIDLKAGIVSRTPLSASNLDFGVINPAFLTNKSRYVYAGVGDPMPKISGVVKLDVERADVAGKDCTVAKRMFGPGCFGGEPFFVAKDDAKDEDDGYVLTYVHNEGTGESRFLVMDAKSPQLEVVASIKLPRRVPYGFHGIFVKEKDFKFQS